MHTNVNSYNTYFHYTKIKTKLLRAMEAYVHEKSYKEARRNIRFLRSCNTRVTKTTDEVLSKIRVCYDIFYPT